MGRLLHTFVLLLPLLGLGGCTVNPATGTQSFTAFMSPEEEARIGAEEHPKILKELGGAYKDTELGAYVARVVFALTKAAEGPKQSFTFTLLNDNQINAMALPGGYVYITRGIMALADNEAEMAGILAHEIGHVVARHPAQQYSRAMAANLGLNILSVLGSVYGAPTGAGNLASLGAMAYLQNFSREQELEADMLAVRYLSRAGYDPAAMVSFFRKMRAQTKLDAALAGQPDQADHFNIMSTHPRTVDRIEQAIRLSKGAKAGTGRLDRLTYLAQIDGMTYGDDPKQGVRRGRVFSHPELRFRFQVPPGFVMFNSPNRVVARGPKKSVIIFDMEKGKKAKAYRNRSMRAYLTGEWAGGLNLKGVEAINLNGFAAATGFGRISGSDGARDARLIAIRGDRDRIYRLAFLTPPNRTRALSTEFRRTTYSFRRLSKGEAAAIRPLRISVVTVRPGDTAQSLSRRMVFETHRLERFETLNGLRRGQALVPGTKVKIVSG